MCLCVSAQTSTPAGSFNVKSNPSGNVSKPSKFQRTNVTRTASSEALDDDLKLPYRSVLPSGVTQMDWSWPSSLQDTCVSSSRSVCVCVCVSIDAYRSTRVKEAERPVVKQVIVRNVDVSRRAEEPRGSGLSSIKQRMKVWDKYLT